MSKISIVVKLSNMKWRIHNVTCNGSDLSYIGQPKKNFEDLLKRTLSLCHKWRNFEIFRYQSLLRFRL